MTTIQEEKKKLRTLAEAADYLGMKEPQFRHLFYNVHGKQIPKPRYIGREFEAKKNLNGVEKEIKGKSMLRFTQRSLDEFLGDASHV